MLRKPVARPYETQEQAEDRERARLAKVEEARQYLSRISPVRLLSIREPEQANSARAKCFRLFESGSRPKDITRRESQFIRRKTLYKYFQEWQIIKALRIIKMDEALREKRRQG
jgi:hypothetical protein